MSLANPDDDYDELVPAGAGKLKKLIKKARFYVIILIIGIIVGAYLQYAYLNPLFSQIQLSSCSDCTKSKELLNKENFCLYSLLQDPQNASSQCEAMRQPLQGPQANAPSNPDGNLPQLDTNTPLKDFNEEPFQP